MPTIKGELRLVTDKAAVVDEVWVRATQVRAVGSNVVVAEPDVIKVEHGSVQFNCLPGAAMLALMSGGRAVEMIPIVVGSEAQQDLGTVVLAASLATGVESSQLDNLAQTIAQDVADAEAVARLITDAKTQITGSVDAAGAAADRAEAAQKIVATAGEEVVRLAGSVDAAKSAAESARDTAARSAQQAGQYQQTASNAAATASASAQSSTKSATEASSFAKSAQEAEQRAVQAAESVSVTPDATTSVKGRVRLAGDLSGTADAPTVPGLALKANVTHTHMSAQVSDATHYTQANMIIRRDDQGRARVKEPSTSEDIANKQYVDRAVGSVNVTIPVQTASVSNAVTVKKYGEVVTIRFKNATTFSGYNLPDGYQPTENTQLVCSAMGTQAVVAIINTAGRISFTGASNSSLTGSCTFIR